MNQKTARLVIFYGIFLILSGLAGYLSNPEKAKTALMSGGTFGSLSIFLGWLGLRQVKWSLIAAKLTAGFLALVFSWRAIVTWGKALQDAPEKLFAACLISAMLVASLALLAVLFKKSEERES